MFKERRTLRGMKYSLFQYVFCTFKTRKILQKVLFKYKTQIVFEIRLIETPHPVNTFTIVVGLFHVWLPPPPRRPRHRHTRLITAPRIRRGLLASSGRGKNNRRVNERRGVSAGACDFPPSRSRASRALFPPGTFRSRARTRSFACHYTHAYVTRTDNWAIHVAAAAATAEQ